MKSGVISVWPKHIHFGEGRVAALPEIMHSLGAGRALVLCGKSVANGVMLETVRSALGDRYAGVFTGVRAQTPIDLVAQAAEAVKAHGADTVVSVGGGSAIDAGKGVVLYCASQGDLRPYSIQYTTRGMERRVLRKSPIRHIAVPTTAGSGSDVMPTAGIHDPQAAKKILFWDDGLIPDATILDPRMAVHAGPVLTAASGMTAVARAIEALYSKHRNPVSTALALHAARLLREALPTSVEEPANLAARADCQIACVMASTAVINAMASLVHAIGHVVGARHGLQHGVAHAILLAPALRRMLPAIGGDYRYVLEALQCPAAESAEAAAGLASAALGRLLARLPLPQRLREVGVKEDDLPGIASAVMGEFMMANLPVPMTADDVGQVLRAAW